MNDDIKPTEDLESTQSAGPPDGIPPERIGPYRILQKIGEGGMGEVYEAEQTEPVRRRVALKLIKWGMDTKQVVGRFESERQALALMDHPAIAKVLDAGATEQGRPYFAMEYVKGEPVTRYCDKHRLDTHERLQLFMQVCDGVQHAHQKGIIHRDLKPTNVLVAIQDDKPVPKIIDFGVAKATEQRLTENTVFTQMGVLVGTPEYMSPEQAEMTGLDVDTRTDVYSLGVMLYELLVGALPFDSKELRKAGFDEIRRKIREDEPSKPSTRLSTLGDASTESAKRRRTDLPTLKRQLHGDLDWITMKALDKDRTRRYGSPSELAADVERHLKDEPVQASPPNTVYRIKKFVRRHKVGVAAGVVVLLALLAGIAGTTLGLVRATRAEAQAKQEAATAEKVSEFLVGLFEVSDPSEARGNTITAREILDNGAEKIGQELENQPLVQARMMDTIGVVYRQLGLLIDAEPLLKQALDTRRRLLGDDHPRTLTSMNNLAFLYYRLSRNDEAEPLFLEALESRRRVLGDDHLDTLTSMTNLANVYSLQRHFDEAEPLYLEALETQKRVLGDDHPDTLWTMNNRANLYLLQGHYDEAEQLYLETVESRRRVIGENHPETLRSMYTLATLYLTQGRYDEGEPLLLESLETRKRVLGDDHVDTLASMNILARLYAGQGRYDEAEPLYLEALETSKRVLGEDSQGTAISMGGLVGLYMDQGRYDEAEQLYLEAIESNKREHGDDHPGTLRLMNGLVWLYLDQERYDVAEQLFLEVIEAQKRTLGDDHPNTLTSMNYLAAIISEQGRYAEAEQLYLETLESRKRVLGDDHADTLRTLNDLGNLYGTQGHYDEAEQLYLKNLEAQRRVLGDDHPDTLFSLYNMACLEALRGNRAKAMDWLRQAVEAGYEYADSMSEDPDLESLHGPEFDAIVERARQNAAAQKAE